MYRPLVVELPADERHAMASEVRCELERRRVAELQRVHHEILQALWSGFTSQAHFGRFVYPDHHRRSNAALERMVEREILPPISPANCLGRRDNLLRVAGLLEITFYGQNEYNLPDEVKRRATLFTALPRFARSWQLVTGSPPPVWDHLNCDRCPSAAHAVQFERELGRCGMHSLHDTYGTLELFNAHAESLPLNDAAARFYLACWPLIRSLLPSFDVHLMRLAQLDARRTAARRVASDPPNLLGYFRLCEAALHTVRRYVQTEAGDERRIIRRATTQMNRLRVDVNQERLCEDGMRDLLGMCGTSVEAISRDQTTVAWMIWNWEVVRQEVNRLLVPPAPAPVSVPTLASFNVP